MELHLHASFLVILIVLSLREDARCKDVFVSRLGRDSKDCGTKKSPCKTINYPFRWNLTKSNDTVRIDGRFRYLHVKTIEIRQENISFTSYFGRAEIAFVGKRQWPWRSFIEVKQRINGIISIYLNNVNFYDMPVYVERKPRNIKEIFIENCTFKIRRNGTGCCNFLDVDVSIISMKGSFQTVKVKNCIFDGGKNTEIHFIELDYIIGVHPKYVNFKVEKSYFYNMGQVLHIENYDVFPFAKYFSIELDGITVGSTGSFINENPCIMVIPYHVTEIRMIVRNSKFKNLRSSKTAAVMNVIGHVDVMIENSKFVSNHGVVGGALVLQLRTATISNCSFINNTVLAESMCGATEMTGFGGALMVKNIKNLTITDSVFVDNFAECYGDSLHALNCKNITVVNTTLSSISKTRVFKTSIWQSISESLILDGLTIVLGYSGELSTKIFIARSKYIKTGRIKPLFVCPIGANINYDYSISGRNIARVSCVKCPKKTYSTDHSYGRISNFENRKAKLHSIQCQKCPFGAICEKKIVPKSNYWGFKYKGLVHIVSCPQRYCCQGASECKSLNSCHGLRRGTLCGQCPESHTQNVFTNACTSNKHCKEWKFWLIFCLLAVLFVAVVAYLQDVFKLVFRLLDLKGVFQMFECMMYPKNRPTDVSSQQDDQENCFSNSERQDQENESKGDEISNASTLHQEDQNINNFGSSYDSSDPSQDAFQPRNRDEHVEASTSTNSTTGGLIKIMFFYYQLNALLMTYKSEVHSSITREIHEFIVTIFNLQINHSTLANYGCAATGSGVLLKTVLKSSFPLAMLIVAMIVLVVISVILRLFPNISIKDQLMSSKNRLLITILQVILLGYSTIMTNIFSLLSCVSLANGIKVLFIDGNIVCYQPWQYAAISFVASWTLPLIFALNVAQKHLHQNAITEKGFYLALLFPLPFLLYKFVHHLCMTKAGIEEGSLDGYQNIEYVTTTSINEGPGGQDSKRNLKAQIQDVLGSAFRRCNSGEQRISWEPCLIGQRLFLLTIHAFFINPVLKAITMLFSMILLAFLNIAVKPYHSKFLNILNITCILFLCTNGIINSVHAYVYVGGTILDGPLFNIMLVFDYIETVTMLVFPSIALLAFVIIIISKVIQAIGKCFVIIKGMFF